MAWQCAACEGGSVVMTRNFCMKEGRWIWHCRYGRHETIRNMKCLSCFLVYFSSNKIINVNWYNGYYEWISVPLWKGFDKLIRAWNKQDNTLHSQSRFVFCWFVVQRIVWVWPGAIETDEFLQWLSGMASAEWRQRETSGVARKTWIFLRIKWNHHKWMFMYVNHLQENEMGMMMFSILSNINKFLSTTI